jgi:hypothetical protein
MNRNNLVFLLTAAMAVVSLSARADVLNPSIGNLLYEENFNSLDSSVWNSIDGDGCEIGL